MLPLPPSPASAVVAAPGVGDAHPGRRQVPSAPDARQRRSPISVGPERPNPLTPRWAPEPLLLRLPPLHPACSWPAVRSRRLQGGRCCQSAGLVGTRRSAPDRPECERPVGGGCGSRYRSAAGRLLAGGCARSPGISQRVGWPRLHMVLRERVAKRLPRRRGRPRPTQRLLILECLVEFGLEVLGLVRPVGSRDRERSAVGRSSRGRGDSPDQ